MLYKRLALLAGLMGAVPLAAAPTAQAPAAHPSPPAIPDLPAVDPAACADPARRAAILADGERISGLFRAYVRAAPGHFINLALWRNAQLRRSGRWTEAQQEAFVTRLGEDPEIRRLIETGETAGREWEQSLDAVAAGADRFITECHFLVSLRDVALRTAPIFEAQWRAVEAVYAAEARRLGVSLE